MITNETTTASSSNTIKHVPSSSLKKILGTAFGIAIIIGGTIGSGILRTPGNIAALLPNYWMICGCWLACGLIILLASGSYAELGVLIPKAGGPYNYVKQAFGSYPSFVISWFDCFNNIIAPAYFCIAIGEFVALLFPALPLSNALVGQIVLIVVTAINIPGIKAGSRFQEITSFIKIIVFGLLIAACFMFGQATNIHAEGSKTFIETVSMTGFVFAFLKAFQLIVGAYDGWWSVSFFAEEDKSPSRNIPRSYFIGICVIISVYVLLNAAIFYVVPMKTAANSALVAADAASILFGSQGQILLISFSILSLISILNAQVLIVPRILFGMSRDGFFLHQATKVNKGGTPVTSMLLAFVVQAILIFISSFNELFSLAAFSNVLISICTFLSLIQLRRKWRNKERLFKAPGYPYSTILCLIIFTSLLVGFCFSDSKSALIMLFIVLLLAPLYFVFVKRNQSTNQQSS